MVVHPGNLVLGCEAAQASTGGCHANNIIYIGLVVHVVVLLLNINIAEIKVTEPYFSIY